MRLKLLCAAAVVSMALDTISSAAILPVVTMSFHGWEASWTQAQAHADGTHVTLTVLVEGTGGAWTVLQKAAVFAQAPSDDTHEPVAITFTQVSPNAAKRLVITQENLNNATGTAWHGFEFVLVGGVQGSAGLPHFDAAASFGGPKPFSIAPFTSVTTTTEDSLVRGIRLEDGQVDPSIIWRPGAISGELIIQASPLVTGVQQFTLLERPLAVPEPAVLGLLVAGPLLLLRRRCN